MALTDDKQRTPAADPEMVVPGPEVRVAATSVAAVENHAVVGETVEPVERSTTGAVRVAEPVRQPRRLDPLTVAYGLVLLLASIGTGLTVGTADTVADAGSPYAPPPAVFVQTD